MKLISTINNFLEKHHLEFLSFNIIDKDFILVQYNDIKLKARLVMAENRLEDLMFSVKFKNTAGVKSMIIETDNEYIELYNDDMYKTIRFLCKILSPVFKKSLSHMFMKNSNININSWASIEVSISDYFYFELNISQTETSSFPKNIEITYSQNLVMITENDDDPDSEINPYGMEMLRNTGFDFLNVYFSRKIDYDISSLIDLSTATNIVEAHYMVEEIKPVVDMIKI